MAGKVYPEWVQMQKTKGTTVKKVGNNYYLYKHTSRRVKGKKYPVPVDTYIGRITPDGIERSDNRRVNTGRDEVIVREYGFSRAVLLRCPEDWKENLPGKWERILTYMIFRESPQTYLLDSCEVPEVEDLGKTYNAQVSMLSRKLYKLYGIGLQDLKVLKTIYLVTIGKTKLISKVSPEQQAVLNKLTLDLEVP